MLNTLGRKLRSKRILCGWKQIDLGRFLGIKRPMTSHLENRGLGARKHRDKINFFLKTDATVLEMMLRAKEKDQGTPSTKGKGEVRDGTNN